MAARRATPGATRVPDAGRGLLQGLKRRAGTPGRGRLPRGGCHGDRVSFTRAGELIARYGGEEFAVLLPAASRESTLTAAENVRRRIADLGLSHPSSTVAPVVTVSVGLAWALPERGALPAGLVEGADRALYRAKREGRNCVREATGPGRDDTGGAA